MFDLPQELWHPAVSHFPIAFLTFSLFLKIAWFVVKDQKLKSNIHFTFKLLLFSGSIMILPTLFLGDMAFDIVKSEICEIAKAYHHEQMGERTLIIYIIICIFVILEELEKFKPFQKIISILILALLFLGTFMLLETSHDGGKLVYEQGAGVKIQKPKCQEL